MIKAFRNNSGFTLTEMAMVVMLMGIIGSILVTSLNARMSQTSYTVTKQRMAAIKEAMISFLRVNGRLPCSATVTDIETEDEGKENADCLSELDIANSFGILPWSTLKLSREAVIDGWGNFFSYHISVEIKNWVVSGKFSDTDQGDFTVLQKKSDGTGTEQVPEVVFVMVSHGPNGKGAGTVKGTPNAPPTGHVHELENTNLDGTYVKRDFSDNTDLVTNPNGPFDDIVEYMTVGDLVGPLIKEGSVQSSAAIISKNNSDLSEKIRKIRYALFYFSSSQLDDPNECSFGKWTANTTMVYGGQRVPTISNGHYYEVDGLDPESDGKTGIIEPIWAIDGTTLVDNHVTWKDKGSLTDFERHYRHRLPMGDSYSTPLGTEAEAIVDSGAGVPYSILGLSSSDIDDPWSKTIPKEKLIYAVHAEVAMTADDYRAGIFFSYTLQGANGVAYRLLSRGPNGDLDTDTEEGWLLSACADDDMCTDVLVSELASAMANVGIKVDSLTCP
ncbi:MAG: type II secretion system protein [Nitrospirae bacterium]|nr:type II secretion system protein [Magnetococcales bacterium]HAT48749.1 hypothetical protein [Alphaproteobacteria bacterium]